MSPLYLIHTAPVTFLIESDGDIDQLREWYPTQLAKLTGFQAEEKKERGSMVPGIGTYHTTHNNQAITQYTHDYFWCWMVYSQRCCCEEYLVYRAMI